MSGFELNKIAASILLASIIAMIVGIVANVLYKPNLSVQNRGYSIAVHNSSDLASKEQEQIVDIAKLMANANAEMGKDLVKKCMSCHTFDKGGVNKVGPNLWNIAGHQKAAHPGYSYSPALLSKGGVWDDESLFHFLHKPSKYVPGTKMSFAGISKPEDVANMIAFLKTFAHD